MGDSYKWKKEIVYVRDTTFGRRHGWSGVGWIVVIYVFFQQSNPEFNSSFFSLKK